MRLAVEVLTGSFFYVEVGDDAKVRDLKGEIAVQVEQPYERLILVLDLSGRHILIEDSKDGAPLADVGVCDGAHIYLFFKARDVVRRRHDQAASDAGAGNSKPDGVEDDRVQPAATDGHEVGSPTSEHRNDPSADADSDQS